VTTLHHTGYTVEDLDRSLAFYGDLLGMEVVARQEKAGGYLAQIVGYPDARVRMAHLRLAGGEHVLEFFEYLAPSGRIATPLQPRDTGTPHLCFAVDDLQVIYERLLAAGADTFVSAPVEVDAGINRGARALYLRDPDGIPVELFQPATGGPA
jgi:catechol 2,3-dioxygenase-like lactoylglutathione lyase family enzyme